jgi:uncharacterized membrane protein YhaH (DUF805 family)
MLIIGGSEMLKGRIGRLQFTLCFLLIITIYVGFLMKAPGSETVNKIEWLIYMALLLLLSSKRFRDLNKSPWKSLYLLIPVLNLYWLGQLIFLRGSLYAESIADKEWRNEDFNR